MISEDRELKPKVVNLTLSFDVLLSNLQFQNCSLTNLEITWSSYKERKGNALALGADEGRG